MSKSTWKKENFVKLEKRLDKVAKRPTSYARRKVQIDAMTEDFPRY